MTNPCADCTSGAFHHCDATRAARPILDVSAARRANEGAGYCWFSEDSMHFFRTRVSESSFTVVPGGTLFVTSDRHPDGEYGWGRAYTVRHIATGEDRGKVSTVGEFGAYASLSGARAAVRRLAAGWDRANIS